MIWCNLNEEGNYLESIIQDAIQVSGKDNDDKKESKLVAFAKGNERVLITKPKIGAWGLNFQHCAHVLTFPYTFIRTALSTHSSLLSIRTKKAGEG